MGESHGPTAGDVGWKEAESQGPSIRAAGQDTTARPAGFLLTLQCEAFRTSQRSRGDLRLQLSDRGSISSGHPVA